MKNVLGLYRYLTKEYPSKILHIVSTDTLVLEDRTLYEKATVSHKGIPLLQCDLSDVNLTFVDNETPEILIDYSKVINQSEVKSEN